MIRKEPLFVLRDGTRVVRVSGWGARLERVEFVEGGHGLVYPWIRSRNEIRVERMLDRRDECANAVHEILEHQAMKYRRWGYDRAHAMANRVEQRIRRRGRPCEYLRRLVRA